MDNLSLKIYTKDKGGVDMEKEHLDILKELAETRDCSIHWRSEYNIALDKAIKELEKNK